MAIVCYIISKFNIENKVRSHVVRPFFIEIMLSADKNVTLTEFQIQTLQIREKELNYFVSLYNSISGKSNF